MSSTNMVLHFSIIGGCGAEPNREIVSFRLVRACARCLCEVRSGRISVLLGRFSLFPCPALQSAIQLQLALSVRPFDLLCRVLQLLKSSRLSFSADAARQILKSRCSILTTHPGLKYENFAREILAFDLCGCTTLAIFEA